MCEVSVEKLQIIRCDRSRVFVVVVVVWGVVVVVVVFKFFRRWCV